MNTDATDGTRPATSAASCAAAASTSDCQSIGTDRCGRCRSQPYGAAGATTAAAHATTTATAAAVAAATALPIRLNRALDLKRRGMNDHNATTVAAAPRMTAVFVGATFAARTSKENR